jgi:hypothetical protein
MTSREGKPAVLISHPTGNQNVRNALRSLVEHEMLAEFWTTVAWNPDSRWNWLVPSKLRNQLARRAFADAPAKMLKCVPWRESVRLGAQPLRLENLLCSGERPFSVTGMYRHFDGRVAESLGKVRVDAVYAYEGGALQTFRQAKRLGLKTLFELPSSHWYWKEKLLQEEAERNPEFAGLLHLPKENAARLDRKDEEIRLADYVFVPSEHVRRTVAGVVPDEKVRVISYGAPPVRSRKQVSTDPARPLKVLFVGALSQLKGISYLLDAVDLLGSQVELTLVGRRFSANARVDEACSRGRWFETLPHSGVIDTMQKADVLVLPSLAEGCALVVLEALACGLPVIITPNTGSLEFVRDGCEGFIVPICRADAIADRLNVLNQDRGLLAHMSQNAQTAAAAHSWDQYRETWAETVKAVSWR